jgi:hypothetical protein
MRRDLRQLGEAAVCVMFHSASHAILFLYGIRE